MARQKQDTHLIEQLLAAEAGACFRIAGFDQSRQQVARGGGSGGVQAGIDRSGKPGADRGGIPGQVALQAPARQPQQAQHQRPTSSLLVASEGRKNRLSLRPFQRPRQNCAHDHIGCHQSHLGIGIHRAAIGLGLQPRQTGPASCCHLRQDPLQLGHLEGLVQEPALLGPLLAVHRKDSPTDQGLQDPEHVGMLGESLHLAHQHLAHCRRLVYQQQVQPHESQRPHRNAEVPFIEQAKPGIKAPADAPQKIRRVGLWRRIDGLLGHGASSCSIRSKPPLRPGSAVRRYSKCKSN